MRRRNRAVAGLCIAVIVFAAFVPGISLHDCALCEPQWILLPGEMPVAVDLTITRCDEQPIPLLSLLPSRAPPSPLA
jgi:hypothetical protein